MKFHIYRLHGGDATDPRPNEAVMYGWRCIDGGRITAGAFGYNRRRDAKRAVINHVKKAARIAERIEEHIVVD